jgi:hypothetical protein
MLWKYHYCDSHCEHNPETSVVECLIHDLKIIYILIDECAAEERDTKSIKNVHNDQQNQSWHCFLDPMSDFSLRDVFAQDIENC